MTPASRSAYLLLTGWLAAFSALPAYAQAPKPTPPSVPAGEARQPSRLTAYLYSKEQIGELYAVGRQWDRKLGLQQVCKSPYNIQPLSLFLLKAIDFPEGKSHPVAGSWQHRFVFERCGKRMTYNAVFVARPGDKPEVRPHVPGTTNASMQQVSEALKTAIPAAQVRLAKRARNCKEADLIDTKLTHPPSTPAETGKPAGRWEETWTFRGCSQDVEVHITFTPDGKGGTHYAIKGAS
jgi:hypothetical protein